MQLDTFLGNDDVKQTIKTALAAGNLPHAVLVAAPDGCGRGCFARCLAADYLFPEGGPAAEAVLRLESPEVLVLAGKGASGGIPIDDVRAVRSEAFLTSMSANGRVVLVKGAHKLAGPAANALLKILEEPPDGVLFILEAYSPSALPVTVQSRCAVFTLTPIGAVLCECRLSAIKPPNLPEIMPNLLTTVYDARYGLCLKALENEKRLDILRGAFLLVKALAKNDKYALLQIFSTYEGQGEDMRPAREALLYDFLCLLELSLREIKVQGIPLLPRDLAGQAIGLVTAARGALVANAAPKITFAALAVEIGR